MRKRNSKSTILKKKNICRLRWKSPPSKSAPADSGKWESASSERKSPGYGRARWNGECCCRRQISFPRWSCAPRTQVSPARSNISGIRPHQKTKWLIIKNLTNLQNPIDRGKKNHRIQMWMSNRKVQRWGMAMEGIDKTRYYRQVV